MFTFYNKAEKWDKGCISREITKKLAITNYIIIHTFFTVDIRLTIWSHQIIKL